MRNRINISYQARQHHPHRAVLHWLCAMLWIERDLLHLLSEKIAASLHRQHSICVSKPTSTLLCIEQSAGVLLTRWPTLRCDRILVVETRKSRTPLKAKTKDRWGTISGIEAALARRSDQRAFIFFGHWDFNFGM
jgi:hypothetical protein